jgi:hypothetical protein
LILYLCIYYVRCVSYVCSKYGIHVKLSYVMMIYTLLSYTTYLYACIQCMMQKNVVDDDNAYCYHLHTRIMT